MSQPSLTFAFQDTYGDVVDRRLAEALFTENEAEERGFSPFERLTCRIHRRWIHDCIASPVHVVPMTGHRWCRRCQRPASIAVDQLDGLVTVLCTRCGRIPGQSATEQIIRVCRASLASARHDDRLALAAA